MKILNFVKPQIFSAEIEIKEIKEHGFIVNPNGIFIIKDNFDKVDQKSLFYTWLLNSKDFRETWEEEIGKTIDIDSDIENTFLAPNNIKVDICLSIDEDFSTFAGFDIRTSISGIESYHNIYFEFDINDKNINKVCNIDFNLRKQSITFDLTEFIKSDFQWDF